MSTSEDFLSKEEVIPNLWSEYEKTHEYKTHGCLLAIPKNHPIVIRREEQGLGMIVNGIQESLSNTKKLYLETLKLRRPSDWILEWQHMHNLLFKWVLLKRGTYRKYEVRFGSLGDEELHKIPKWEMINIRLGELADQVNYLINLKNDSIDEQLYLMAKIHYGFIQVHPFPDGNGRIGRIIIDQLCLAHGLPMIMGGYPRSNKEQQKRYHDAITSCATDIDCRNLSLWIKSKLEKNLQFIG